MEEYPPLPTDDHPIWGNRAKAVQAYANLEQALCRLFALLCGIQLDAAGIIFFKITNTQARNDILDKLFRWRFKDEFNLFRNSLFKTLRPIDIRRNEIIHWNTVCGQICTLHRFAQVLVFGHSEGKAPWPST